MNGIEKLIQQIDAEAQSEIDAIQAKAAAEAAEVKAQYAQRAERESQDILDRGRKAAAEREERLAGVAQLERRKTLLAVKQEMLDQGIFGGEGGRTLSRCLPWNPLRVDASLRGLTGDGNVRAVFHRTRKAETPESISASICVC